MANKFCRYISNQYRVDFGKISPCCYMTREADLKNTIEVVEYTKWLSGINDWVPECNHCKMQEEEGLESPRMQSLKNAKVNEFNGDDDPDEITSLEFQTGNECNAACLMCGPHSSTTWQKYVTNKNIFKIEDNFNDSAVVDVGLTDLKKIVSLEKVNFLGFVNGGEPLKTRIHIDIINNIRQVRDLNEIKLAYITNGSIRVTDEVVEIWKQAKSVMLYISVDAIGEHFNYLRWPLQWNQVEANIRYLLDLDIPNLKIGFSYSVNPFSLYYHSAYVDWAESFFKDTKKINPTAKFKHPFRAGGVINMSCVPPKLATLINRKYYSHPNGKKVISMLSGYDEKQYKKFIEYIIYHDKKRNTNFREVFPEIQHFFNEIP